MTMQKNEKIIAFALELVVFLSYFATYAVQTTCPEGTYLQYFEDISSCEECPPGTFMPWENHTASKCFQCTAIVNTTVEVLITPCDRFRDADIQCVDGYYRRLARNPREEPTCLKCRESCPEHFFEVHRCEHFNDIGCCPGENYDYYIDKSGVRMCRERPWMCGKGEYLDTHLNDCKPCPKNTFMSEDYHSHTKCWDCGYKSEADLPLYSTIIENCTSTRPAKYGCKDGFYVNHGLSYRGNDIGCAPCKMCDVGMYEVRQCDGYYDAACCSNPNTPVVAGPLGGQCIDKIDELHIYPTVETLRVREGGCQSLLCYIAWTKNSMRYHLELVWVGPNVDKHQQFHYENGSYQSEVIVYHNKLTVCDFSAADEGQYQCRDVHGNLEQNKLINVVLACQTGTYNPPACNKSCSERCRASEIPDISPCDHRHGTCLFGCLEGYTGSMCDTRHVLEERTDKPAVFASTIAVSVILVLVLTVVIICIVYIKRCQGTGPKLWQRLVWHILPQYSQESTYEEHSMLLDIITQNEQRSLSIEHVKNKLRKVVNNLQQMATFCSGAAVKCQEDISEIFCNYFEFRSEIGDFVTDLCLPETCLQIGRQYLKERESIKDDETWAIVYSTYKVTRDYSAGSSRFAKRLAELGAVEFLTGILAENSYVDNLNEERDFHVVKATMVGLRHMALYAENIDILLKRSRTVEVLMRLTNSDKEDIKTLANFTVDTIKSVEEKNVHTSEKADSSIQDMEAENAKLTDDVIELKDEVKRISQEKTELKDEVKKMHQDNSELKDEVKRMHEENSDLKDVVKKMHQENSELKDVVKRMHQENSELKDEVEKMHQDNSELKDEVKKMHQENSELKDEVKRIGHRRTELPNKFKMKPEMAFAKLNIGTLRGVEKSLSINRVKKELTEAVMMLKRINPYHSDQNIKCQQSIYQIFWNYFPFRKDTGDHLAKLGLPEICVKILKKYLEGENNVLQDDEKWLIIVHTYNVSRSYSHGSVKFAKSFARAGAVNLMTNILGNKSFLHSLHAQGREYDVVQVSIVGLRLLAMYAGNIDDFQSCKTVEVLKPLTKSENESIKRLAEITVNCISENEGNDMTDTPVIEGQPPHSGDAAKYVEKQPLLEESPDPLQKRKNEPNVPCTIHNVDTLKKIWGIFVAHITPKKIMHIFPFYKTHILKQLDIDIVLFVASQVRKKEAAAAELLHRLAKQEEWYSCLLLVLRDPLVKEDHVADRMEKAVGCDSKRFRHASGGLDEQNPSHRRIDSGLGEEI